MCGTAWASSPCPVTEQNRLPPGLRAIDQAGRQQRRPQQTHRVSSSDTAAGRRRQGPTRFPVSSVCPQSTLPRTTLLDPPPLPRPEIHTWRHMAPGDLLPGSFSPSPRRKALMVPLQAHPHVHCVLRVLQRNRSSGMCVGPRKRTRSVGIRSRGQGSRVLHHALQ